MGNGLNSSQKVSRSILNVCRDNTQGAEYSAMHYQDLLFGLDSMKLLLITGSSARQAKLGILQYPKAIVSKMCKLFHRHYQDSLHVFVQADKGSHFQT